MSVIGQSVRRVSWHAFAGLSRLLNRLMGGGKGKTLCHRVALRWGWNCRFCRVVSWVLNDKDHCLDELSAQEIHDLAKRRKPSRKVPR